MLKAMPSFNEAAEDASLAIDGAGVLVIVLGLLAAVARFTIFRKSADPSPTGNFDRISDEAFFSGWNFWWPPTLFAP